MHVQALLAYRATRHLHHVALRHQELSANLLALVEGLVRLVGQEGDAQVSSMHMCYVDEHARPCPWTCPWTCPCPYLVGEEGDVGVHLLRLLAHSRRVLLVRNLLEAEIVNLQPHARVVGGYLACLRRQRVAPLLNHNLYRSSTHTHRRPRSEHTECTLRASRVSDSDDHQLPIELLLEARRARLPKLLVGHCPMHLCVRGCARATSEDAHPRATC